MPSHGVSIRETEVASEGGGQTPAGSAMLCNWSTALTVHSAVYQCHVNLGRETSTGKLKNADCPASSLSHARVYHHHYQATSATRTSHLSPSPCPSSQSLDIKADRRQWEEKRHHRLISSCKAPGQGLTSQPSLSQDSEVGQKHQAGLSLILCLIVPLRKQREMGHGPEISVVIPKQAVASFQRGLASAQPWDFLLSKGN